MFEKLQELPLLIGLSINELMAILENVKFEFNKYPEGTTVVNQGDRCDKIVYVLKGELCVDRRGDDMLFTEYINDSPFLLEPENLWGMKQKYTHTYSFHTEGNTCSIDKKQLNYLISNYEIVKTNLLSMVCNKLQTANQALLLPISSDLEERVIRYFRNNMLTKTGRKSIRIKMNALADAVDGTRLNISRILNEWQEKKLATLSRGMIEIPDRCIFNMNPFFSTYDTPHETVPFDKITINDFEPAIMKGIEEEDEVIDAIVNNPDTPTFENTIEALENSGELLSKVTEVFFNLLSAETTDEMDELAQKLSPILSEHGNNITLNEKLFERVKAVYENVDKNSLTKEQQRLLQDSYDSFVRNGANLNEEDKQKYRQLTSELGVLSLQFSQNKLKDLNAFTLHITDEAELEGLPESAIDAAKEEAKSRNLEGWVFTLQAPSYGPFLTYSAKRELRKQMYMAYNTICTHDNENNNLDIVKQIVNHHREIAQLLGYKTYADYTLVKRMAQNSETVYNLLNQLLEAYKPTAKKEVEEVRKMAKEMTGDEQFELQPWDFGYYSNKLKERDYNINSEMLRPYFELSKVKKGVFGLATKLYGIRFKLNKDIPVYHPDVEAYEVFDKDGKYLAVLYCDFHPRKSKKSGAWMTSYKEQWIDKNGVNSRPHVSVTMNLTKPTAEKPSLLTLGEVETFLHEFGHSLHGIFANTKYKSLSGTNVYWDFVELPSQFMENYAVEKDFLNTFAFHYQTGEPLPDELIQRIVKSRNFNVAYACLRQLSFGLLDMAYYTKETAFDDDVKEFEKSAWKETQLLPQVPEACMSVQFSHIMAGGYSAGYYSYKWAEVLDADAFSLFKQNGIFDSATAQRFRDNVLSKGGTEPPMDLYIRFRGQKPSIDALLKRNGIVKSESRI